MTCRVVSHGWKVQFALSGGGHNGGPRPRASTGKEGQMKRKRGLSVVEQCEWVAEKAKISAAVILYM